MAWNDWEDVYARQEASPLDRFKNKNKILKIFGPPGVRAYDEMDGQKSAREIQTSLGIDPEIFGRIMEQLIGDNAIAASGSAVRCSANSARRLAYFIGMRVAWTSA